MRAPDPVIGVKNIPNTFLAENYTTGGEGITWHDSDTINEGEIYRHDGVDIEPCADGNANIFNIVAGEWLDYRLNVPTTANYRFEFRVASPQGKGAFHVEVDGVDKTGGITLPVTGSFQTWTVVSVTDIALASGVHTFRFCMDEGGFNLAGFAISFAAPAIPVGKRITIQNGSNYVTFNAQNQIICNSPTITPDCIFTVEQNGNFIELKAANGQYVSTTGTKNPMTLSAGNRTATTKFLWHNLQNNSKLFGLKSLRTNAVVCSENGTKPMNCDRYDFGGWEKFTWSEYAASSIDGLQAERISLEIYPMPAASNSSVIASFNTGSTSPVSLRIIDMHGRVCRQLEQPDGNGNREVNISTEGIPSGFYMLQVVASGVFAAKRMVVI
ncbi:MAG: carbohydrate-binding protein [Dysgonamonadaceae bacterium]|nr:carbohydrate-binding protein [Dysgonamonadaceae bacterium]